MTRQDYIDKFFSIYGYPKDGKITVEYKKEVFLKQCKEIGIEKIYSSARRIFRDELICKSDDGSDGVLLFCVWPFTVTKKKINKELLFLFDNTYFVDDDDPDYMISGFEIQGIDPVRDVKKLQYVESNHKYMLVYTKEDGYIGD